MHKWALRIGKTIISAVTWEDPDDTGKRIDTIVTWVRTWLLKTGSQKAIENVRVFAERLLEMADTTTLPPSKATIENWNSQEVNIFLKKYMPNGEFTDIDTFWEYVAEWNSRKQESGKILAEEYGYILQENTWTLKSVFWTNSLTKILSKLGFKKQGYTDITLLKGIFSGSNHVFFQEQWEQSEWGTPWEKLANFLKVNASEHSTPEKRLVLGKYFQSIVPEGKRVSIDKIVAYLGLKPLEITSFTLDFSGFAEKLRGHKKYSEVTEAINGWDTIIEICKEINTEIEKWGKKMPITKKEITELCKEYDVRYKDQRISFDTLVRLLGKCEESKKTAPKEIVNPPQERKAIIIPTFRPSIPPQTDTIKRDTSRAISELWVRNDRKRYTKNCTKNNGSVAELSLPNWTKEEIVRFFLESVEDTPRWQTLLSPIEKEEDQKLWIRKLGIQLNTSYEESQKRWFFFPSTFPIYEEILSPDSNKEEFSVSDMILAITGKKRPGRPAGTTIKTPALKPAISISTWSSLNVSWALSKEDKEVRVNTGKTLFRRDIGLLAGMELENFLLIGATFEVDPTEKTILFTCSKEESDSQKTTEIWSKILTNDWLNSLWKKWYAYNPRTSLLSISLNGWTYGMTVPRIRSSGSGTTPLSTNKANTSDDGMKKLQSEVTAARSEFQGIINTVLWNYYNRLVTNKIGHIPPKNLLQIDFEKCLGTIMDAKNKTLTISYSHGHDVKYNIAKDILQSIQPREFTGCTISGGAGEKRIVGYKTKNDWTISFRLSY